MRESIQRHARVSLIGATADDARDIMVEGESGILSICSRDERPIYRKSERRLLWPNGAISLIFTADEPDRARGKQHERVWADEAGSWRYAEAAWDQMMLGLRLGSDPRAVVTTTPRPTPLIRRLMNDPACVVTEGSTYDNRANLADAFFAAIIRRYEGTRLGRQELLAELLTDNPGALWTRARIEESRIERGDLPRALERIVVAIDPAVSSGEEAAEAGIVVAGLYGEHYYVLDDRSRQDTPQGWASEAVACYRRWKADRVVGEINNGGEMIEALLRTVDANVSYRSVRATRGKALRAEPVAALYEQGRVHHVGMFGRLEDQMCEWVPGDASPDRLDALVWAITELTEGQAGAPAAILGQTRRRD